MRQQLAILKRKTKRPKLNNADRVFWVALSRLPKHPTRLRLGIVVATPALAFMRDGRRLLTP
ncbi:MAG: hypothetical protein WBM46_03700 [Polyangiales bacterium]|jgi:hypothetical protein